MESQEITPHLFRTEYSKIVAVLCKSFDLKHIEIAEDIAADTFLKASETWALNGVPQNPAAWLYTVAKNKTRDYFKRAAVYESRVKKSLIDDGAPDYPEIDFDQQVIADSQLAMIFAVCNPANSSEAQICLALQILCGFSVKEIANAFLTKTETIKKRLQRAREVLRNDKFEVRAPNAAEVAERLPSVLTTLYLLFNEGYFSTTADQFIRKDLCAEAVRLALLLTDNALTNTSEAQALLALMCFQSSRMNARVSANDEAVLLDEQDKTAWDGQLIDQGNRHLVRAFANSEVSKYHLEAAIAYWHTAPDPKNKWENILLLYDSLLMIENSPVAALNRVFAFAKIHGNEAAILEALQLSAGDGAQYHALLGYLYAETDRQVAIHHYQRAMELSISATEKAQLAKAISSLIETRN